MKATATQPVRFGPVELWQGDALALLAASSRRARAHPDFYRAVERGQSKLPARAGAPSVSR